FRLYRSGFQCPIRPWLSGLICISMCCVCSGYGISRACTLPFFALLIWGLATYQEGLLSGSFAVYWGKVSYSLYMTHGLCQIMLNRALPVARFQSNSAAVRAEIMAAYFLLVIVSALLTYHLIEVPARQWLHPTPKGKPLAANPVDVLQTSAKQSA